MKYLEAKALGQKLRRDHENKALHIGDDDDLENKAEPEPDEESEGKPPEIPGDPGDSLDEGDSEVEVAEVPEWPLKTPPAEYLERSPEGPNADLAREILARADD